MIVYCVLNYSWLIVRLLMNTTTKLIILFWVSSLGSCSMHPWLYIGPLAFHSLVHITNEAAVHHRGIPLLRNQVMDQATNTFQSGNSTCKSFKSSVFLIATWHYSGCLTNWGAWARSPLVNQLFTVLLVAYTDKIGHPHKCPLVHLLNSWSVLYCATSSIHTW